ncbi:hypothetical protein EW145_g5972 [Phellinidium pouzarii]|uniref:Uncharacterized protein n=1 Tax=Phellinidium pouzarii TaxID=167371 RepID=A0A4S4KZZ1_9AGAM|nr:hypothetical protein EW145_g5972 [Phellinidium pouzarii]
MEKKPEIFSGSSQGTSQNPTAIDALAAELENAEIQSSSEAQAEATQHVAEGPRPRIVYSRKQLLHLSQSPLVNPPNDMPEFKSWFGELSDQSLLTSKKESETPNANDIDVKLKMQMGNFKHQPLRASDRDRDRDTERDLRTLSDKYDRERGRGDRIGLPSHSTLLRNRDRDSAPHLVPDRDAQRPLNRKRNGESKEDWRRGAEPPRPNRDEPLTRRDRDDRERPRSRARDSSRQRESPPSTRRERDDHRRDRDRDRFVDADEDTRRWRDDGKRDERVSARREKDRLDRDGKDKGRDRSREHGDPDRDLREGWSIAEDRAQKRAIRDRRHDDGRDKDDRKEREREKEPAWMETYVPPSSSSGGILGGKGAEGEVDSIQAWKKDMKEREMKAKGLSIEISDSGVGASQETITDVKQSKTSAPAPETQLDEIQLFKLMMKQEEKKRAANGDNVNTSDERSPLSSGGRQATENGIPGLMRIREGRTTASSTNVMRGDLPATSLSEISPISIDPLLASNSNSSIKSSISSGTSKASSQSTASLLSASNSLSGAATPPTLMRTESSGPRLLPIKTSESAVTHSDLQNMNKDSNSPQVPFDPPRQSRLLAFGAQSAKIPAQPTPQSASAAVQMSRLQQLDSLWPNQRRPSASPVFQQHPASQQPGLDKANMQQHMLAGQYEFNIVDNIPRRTAVEATGIHSSSYDNVARIHADSSREFNSGDVSHSSSIPLTSASDRAAFISQSDALHYLSDIRRNPTPPISGFGATSPISPFDNQQGGGQSSYSSGKGSRMAKHFEKLRDPHSQTTNMGRVNNPSMNSNGGMPGRQEYQVYGNSLGGAENRNIQDLLTMLNNSAQAQRGHQVHALNQNLGPHQPSLHMGPSGSMGRHDSLSDPDEGRFAPDGLVPGLRPVPNPAHRNRDINNGNMYPNQLDEAIAYNARLNSQQRGGMEQLFSGPIPQYNGQGPTGGRGNLNFQQQTMRGGPSPINNFNPAQGPLQQRLPPGLANLGGRPPHEPSQFLGGGVGAGNFTVPSQLHAGLQHTANAQSFNQFQSPSMGGIAGNQNHLRGQPGLGQLGNPLGNGLNSVDFRGGPGGLQQNQMLGLGGPNVGQAMRGGPVYSSQQLHGPNQLPHSMGLRQQHNLQPQLMPQMLPPQLQQHGIPGGQHNPSDLMALLMGGTHRE